MADYTNYTKQEMQAYAIAKNIKLGYGGCMPDRLLSLGEKILQIEDSRNDTSKDDERDAVAYATVIDLLA